MHSSKYAGFKPANVRISETEHRLLNQLARKADTSMSVVHNAALEKYRRHRFLAQAAAAYETLAADPAFASDYHREINDLDGSTGDGLQGTGVRSASVRATASRAV